MDNKLILVSLLIVLLFNFTLVSSNKIINSDTVRQAKKQWSLFGHEIFSLTQEVPVTVIFKEIKIEKEKENEKKVKLIEEDSRFDSKYFIQLLQSMGFPTNEMGEILNGLPVSSWQACIVIAIAIKLAYKKIKKNPVLPFECGCKKTEERLALRIDELSSNVSDLLKDRQLIFQLLKERTDMDIENRNKPLPSFSHLSSFIKQNDYLNKRSKSK